MASATVLSLRAVTKAFPPRRGRRGEPVTVLSGIDLDVAAGEIVAVLGPSGSGKTTLLRIIAGFDEPDAGEVVIGGRTVAGPGRFVPPERRGVGVVPQEGALFPHLDVAGNVAYGLGRGAERTDRAGRVADCLALVGLAGFERARPHELSGGQQQRVALARALAPEPSLIVLDEPFSSLDAALRIQLRAEVATTLRTVGATALVVTHDQQEALAMADRVAVLLGGHLAQVATPEVVYRRPATLAVATFVGEAVVLPGVVAAGTVSTALGSLEPIESVPSGPATVVVRPEQIRLGRAPGVAATVTAVAFLGHEAVVTVALDVGGTLSARLPVGGLPPVGGATTVAVQGPVVAFPA
jgi:iron(III) transport system ATP-binding protein